MKTLLEAMADYADKHQPKGREDDYDPEYWAQVEAGQVQGMEDEAEVEEGENAVDE